MSDDAPAIALKLILGGAFLLVLAANLPGQLSWDSVNALWQVHHPEAPLLYDPPIMNVFLRFFDGIVPGPALYVTAQVLLFFGSLLAFCRLSDRPSLWGVVAALFVVASPLVVVTQATVWHDVLFANLALAGFACLAWSAKCWVKPLERTMAQAGSILLLTCAVFARQNGIICLVVACACVFVIAWNSRRAAVRTIGVGFSAAAFLLLISFNIAFSLHKANADYGSGLTTVQTYDIVGVVKLDPHVDLSILDHGDAATDEMIRRESAKFSPAHIDYIPRDMPTLWSYLENQPPSVIAGEWRWMVFHDPSAYFRQRVAAFDWIFLTPDIFQCSPVVTGVGGDPKQAQELSLQLGKRQQDRMLFEYAANYFKTPIYSHALYAGISLVLLVLLALRRTPTDIAVLSMIVSALLVEGSYFLIAFSCGFRYLYFCDMASLAALLYVASNPVGFFKRSPAP